MASLSSLLMNFVYYVFFIYREITRREPVSPTGLTRLLKLFASQTSN